MTRLAYLSTDPGVAYGGTKGASIHVGELVAALAAEGAAVLLLVAGVDSNAPPPPPGVEVEVLPGPAKGTTVDRRLAAETERAAWLEDRLAAFGAAALYERFALHSAAGSTGAARLSVPHVVELNAPLPEEAATYRKLDHPAAAERLEHQVLRSAATVLVVSRPLAAYVSSRAPMTPVEVLPNAVAIERFPRRQRRRHERPVAVFCGSLRPWHGAEVIAEAWASLASAAPRLLVVGDGPCRPALEAAGAELVGPVSHERVPAWLARADIGLAPYAAGSPNYFSPIKLFEYLAAGLAVVAGDLPGVTDVVDETTAVVIPAGSATHLAEAVAALAADPDRRANLAESGRALVASAHTWTHRARRVLRLVSELASLGLGGQ